MNKSDHVAKNIWEEYKEAIIITFVQPRKSGVTAADGKYLVVYHIHLEFCFHFCTSLFNQISKQLVIGFYKFNHIFGIKLINYDIQANDLDMT